MNVVMIPSVGGGMGHIARTATLARTLKKLDSSVNVEYVLDAERLRPLNIEATRRTGYRVTLLPKRERDTRDAVVRACLDRADVIVDDTQRYLIPLRRIVPDAAWVSIPMYPLGDELFNDWPLLAQADRIIWAYPPALDFPPELEMFDAKMMLLRTGPFLELEGVPERDEARRQLGFQSDEEVVVYAPRGMTFGRDFGERVLSSVFGAVEQLRAEGRALRLVLLAINRLDEIHAPGVPAELPGWVTIRPVVPPVEMLTYIRAASIAVTEGSNMTQEAAALGTPIVMVPGPIYESWVLGTRLNEHTAAYVIWIERVTPESVAAAFRDALADPDKCARMRERARELISGGGGGGVEAAARLVLKEGRHARSGPRK